MSSTASPGATDSRFDEQAAARLFPSFPTPCSRKTRAYSAALATLTQRIRDQETQENVATNLSTPSSAPRVEAGAFRVFRTYRSAARSARRQASASPTCSSSALSSPSPASFPVLEEDSGGNHSVADIQHVPEAEAVATSPGSSPVAEVLSMTSYI